MLAHLPYRGPLKVVLFSKWECIPGYLVAQTFGAGRSKTITLSHPSYSPHTKYVHSAKCTKSDVSQWMILPVAGAYAPVL